MSWKKKYRKKKRKFNKRLKAKLVNYGKQHHWFLTLLRKAMFIRGRAKYLHHYLSNTTNDKMVIFEAYMGRQYACSPKAIYLRMLNDERFDDFTFVWAFKHPNDFKYLEENKNTIVLKYGRKAYLRYHAQAKYWITNSRLKERIIKRKDQVYIQCWHGTPLKKLGYDIDVKGGNAMNSIKDIQRKYTIDSSRYTYMISPSEFCTEKFASAFNLPDKSIIQTIGYPRNDFLYNYTHNDVESIKEKLEIPSDKKVILYAPTWRDNQHVAGQGYTYQIAIDFDKLREKFADNYVILFRTHYFVSNSIDLTPYEGFVYNVSTYDDINELYVISDVLITDYSSVFFDYANLKRPIIFYMYDFEEYKNNLRDFYIDLSELPGPIVKTEEKLIEEIKDLNNYNEKYSDIYSEFSSKFNSLEDGNASLRVIEKCILNN
ncbi:MAG: CDP-glycerol glycerophosphotransferase family protein [Eubacterium sp.]